MDEYKIHKKLSNYKGGSNSSRFNTPNTFKIEGIEGRVAPNACDLEEAVLGALLLDKYAISKIIDILSPESFYKEIHGTIYHSILCLYHDANPIDILTVTQHLKKLDKLQDVGGAYYITTLTNRVASTDNIEYHARIIQQKYISRKLIQMSIQSIDMAYDGSTDVFEILDSQQTMLNNLTMNAIRQKEKTGSRLFSEYIKHLEKMSQNNELITGIPTTIREFNQITRGMQNSDLILVCGRPGSGKSSAMKNFIKGAVDIKRKPVLIFSLEMSAQQQIARLISQDLEVPMQDFNTKDFLNKTDFAKINSSINPYFDKEHRDLLIIDDSATITINELKAKAKRVHSEHGICMILIDYLQLIKSPKIENKVYELEAVSQGLKALAKELNIPVVALAQLSREVEKRNPPRPMLSDLRGSGCLSANTIIVNPETGKRTTIKELSESNSNTVCLAMHQDLKIRPSFMSKIFYSGEKEVFEITTKTGKKIKASANHPFYRLDGWKRLDELKVGDKIGVAREIKTNCSNNTLSKDELGFIAHMIGNGCFSKKRSSFRYTTPDINCVNYMTDIAKNLFGITAITQNMGKYYVMRFPSPYRLTHNVRNPITYFFIKHNIKKTTAKYKELPQELFNMDLKHISHFIRHIFATDGSITKQVQKNNRQPKISVYYSSNSEIMIRQLHHLLLRFEIRSKITKSFKKGYEDPTYLLNIYGKYDTLNFLNKIGCFGARGSRIEEFKNILHSLKSNTNTDVIPKEAWNTIIKDSRVKIGMGYREFGLKMSAGSSYSINNKNGISRDRMKRIYSILKDNKFINLAESDIYWDEIVSIQSKGVEPVYDASVPEYHNFVANDFIVHNSMEQDADMVIFLYRPEYYGITEQEDGTSTKGFAEWIIAKHRNGELGTVKTRFIHHLTKFTDWESSIVQPNFAGMNKEQPTEIYNPGAGLAPNTDFEKKDVPF